MNDVNQGRSFNQLTSNYYDKCEFDNKLKLSSKPLRYFTSVLNSPEFNPYTEFTAVGNIKVYNVENEYQRPLPTNLRDSKSVYVMPYSTTPNLGQAGSSMLYINTESNLKLGLGLRDKKSTVALSEVDYDQWSPGVDEITVQNAGQFNNNGGALSQLGPAANYRQLNYYDPNNVIFANGVWPREGISSRNQLHNAATLGIKY